MAAFRMHEVYHQHTPVLLHEAVVNLITQKEGLYIDATFGRGSHTEAILKQLCPNGRLLAFDKDPEAIAFGQQHFSHEPRLQIFHRSYTALPDVLTELNCMG